MSTAARVTPPAGSPAGTGAVDNACGSWLAATDCVAETRAGPTSHGSSLHSKSTGAQNCSGARGFGRLHYGTIREPQFSDTPGAGSGHLLTNRNDCAALSVTW
jgi:hypothetical protein